MKIFTFLYSYMATLHHDAKGASAIEYAIIAGLIAVALIAGVAVLAGGLDEFFAFIANTLPSGPE
ncbi:Flp family type IVb pilin [Vreelandella zhanjiangensis]|uniref:Flp family type IVb pilin n=1 Tax=Vreelandella zhanjiangensis TaxID=1121960 RepID=UPI00037CFC8C|nr:Flp family type IVb pilin [Halomonas zhanjiangensis]